MAVPVTMGIEVLVEPIVVIVRDKKKLLPSEQIVRPRCHGRPLQKIIVEHSKLIFL